MYRSATRIRPLIHLNLIIHHFPIITLINPRQIHRSLVMRRGTKWLQLKVRTARHDLPDIVQAMPCDGCRFGSPCIVACLFGWYPYNVEATELMDHRDREWHPSLSQMHDSTVCRCKRRPICDALRGAQVVSIRVVERPQYSWSFYMPCFGIIVADIACVGTEILEANEHARRVWRVWTQD